MSRLIDADALERDGWRMSRTVQIDEKTMEAQTRKPTDFPAVEPQKGKWIDEGQYADFFPHHAYRCSECGHHLLEIEVIYDFCPFCGADMRDTDGSED